MHAYFHIAVRFSRAYLGWRTNQRTKVSSWKAHRNVENACINGVCKFGLCLQQEIWNRDTTNDKERGKTCFTGLQLYRWSEKCQTVIQIQFVTLAVVSYIWMIELYSDVKFIFVTHLGLRHTCNVTLAKFLKQKIFWWTDIFSQKMILYFKIFSVQRTQR